MKSRPQAAFSKAHLRILTAVLLFIGSAAATAGAQVTRPVRLQRPAPSANTAAPHSQFTVPGWLNSNFSPYWTYDAGGVLTNWVTVADLNGDGKLDIVVANTYCYSVGDSCVAVLMNAGTGFHPAVDYSTGGGGIPWSVVVADVNGDSKPDIIVANQSTGTVGVLLGNGDGTFRPAVSFSSGGANSVSVALADLNGDHQPDIVVANAGSDNIGVLLGNGDGTFRPAVMYDSGGHTPSFVTIADLNADGKPDVVVANTDLCSSNCYDNGGVAVLMGKGDGTLQKAVTYAMGEPVYGVAVADFNQDGKPDIAAVLGWLSVLAGNGDGTFQPPVQVSNGMGASSLAVADVNGDGIPDLIWGTGTQTMIMVQLGAGDGTFFGPDAYLWPSGDYGYYVMNPAVGDLSNDGIPDIVAVVECSDYDCQTDGLVQVLLNNLAPTSLAFASSLNPSLAGQAVSLTAKLTSRYKADGELITFSNGSAVLGTAQLSGGVASLTTSSLPTGFLNLTASYESDFHNYASTSPVLQQVVNSTSKWATMTTLTSNLSPAVYGQKITFTATVRSSGSLTPTGIVSFVWTNGWRTFSAGSATVNAQGIATLTALLNAGVYPMRAIYRGDANNLSSTSAVISQSITPTTSAAKLVASPNSARVGQPIAFSATITSPTVMPTGPVTFKLATTVLGTAQLMNGKATFTTTALPVGSNVVKVIYSGDSNIAKSSAGVTVVVQP